MRELQIYKLDICLNAQQEYDKSQEHPLGISFTDFLVVVLLLIPDSLIRFLISCMKREEDERRGCASS